MTVIHEPHKIFCRAEPARRREIIYHLIPPRLVKRMLHHWHQLHVRVTRFLHIVHDLNRKLAVIQKPAGLIPLKASGMQFINRNRTLLKIVRLPAFHPAVIAPFKPFNAADNRARFRPHFHLKRIRIAL